ncbi:MAG: hypothetical protein IJ693_08430 [Bacteroidaceae bacterium]|nr:hypothetical protein [Bacteroidaceae bacterium]
MTNFLLAMPQVATNKNEYVARRRGYRMAEPPEAPIRFYSSSLGDMKKYSPYSSNSLL